MTLSSPRPPPAHTPDASKLKSPPPPPPPLPHALEHLVNSLLRRLQDLEHYQIPQLAQCTGPLAFHDELAGQCRQELAGCKRDLEELKLEVDDLEKARDRLAAADHVKQVQQRLDACTKLYRQAVVASKRQIDAYSHLSARDELLAGHGSDAGRDSPAPGGYGSMRGGARSPAGGQNQDDALMSATSDVTEGLRRTLQLMQQEVDRSLVSNELLQSQTQTMQLTTDEYSTLSSLLSTSKNLITSLERADVVDRLLLFGAFAFFAAVCAHIFKKRVLDRGVRVASFLGNAVARSGGAIAGVAKHAGVAEHVERAEELHHAVASKGVVDAAASIVRSEITQEVTQLAATATAVAAAVKAGVTSIAHGGRGASGHSRAEAIRRAQMGMFDDEEEMVPRREEERKAAPVETPSPVSVADVEEEEKELPFEDAPEEPLFQHDQAEDLPIPATPLDSISDEALASSSLPPLPSSLTSDPVPSPSPTPSPTPSPSSVSHAENDAPAAELPLDATPAPQEGHGVFQPGDPDLHRAPPAVSSSLSFTDAADVPPAVETAAGTAPAHLKELEALEGLRERAAPTPSLPVLEELAGETPAVLPVAKPDLEEAVEKGKREEQAKEQESGKEEKKVFEPLESFRPTRPDLDQQLGDVEAVVEENRVSPSSPSPIDVVAEEFAPSADFDEAKEPVDLPTSSLSFPSSASSDDDPSSILDSTTLPHPPSQPGEYDPSPSSASLAEEEAVHIPVDDPSLLPDNPAGVVRAAHEAEQAREVAGPEGTTVPLSSPASSSSSSSEEKEEEELAAPPPLDVNESGAPPASAAFEASDEDAQAELVNAQVELPIDLGTSQTLWDDADAAKVQAEAHEDSEELDHAFESAPRTDQAVDAEHRLPASSAAEEDQEDQEEQRRVGEREEEEEETSEESLLDEMLDRAFGGVPAVGGLVPNTTEAAPASVESVEEEAVEEEPADEQISHEEALPSEEVEEAVEPPVENAGEPQVAEELDASSPYPSAVDEPPPSAMRSPTSALEPAGTPSPLPTANLDTSLDLETEVEDVLEAAPPAAEAEAEPSPSTAPSSVDATPPPSASAEETAAPTPTPQPDLEVNAGEGALPPTETETRARSSDSAPVEEETAAPSRASEPVHLEEETLEDEDGEPYEDEYEEEPLDLVREKQEQSGEDGSPPPAAPSAADHAGEEDGHIELEADIPNSDAIYPDASVEDAPSVVEEQAAALPLDGAAEEVEDDEGVFEHAAEDAVEGHVGEEEEGESEEALHLAEDRLHELEDEGDAEEEFDAGEQEVEHDEL
ncbi:hypothetical protein JCM8097_007608 [Rhodosporidiobolus ruineniae]